MGVLGGRARRRALGTLLALLEPAARSAPMRTTSRTARLAALLLVAIASGCIAPVPFHERRLHADPLMAFVDNPTETHWYGKVIHSMEGSTGAVGANGGGGCGCY